MWPSPPVYLTLCQMASPGREWSRWKMQSFYNLVSGLTSYHFCCSLCIRSKSINSVHALGLEITPACEYQEVEIIGNHPRDCLVQPSSPATYTSWVTGQRIEFDFFFQFFGINGHRHLMKSFKHCVLFSNEFRQNGHHGDGFQVCSGLQDTSC